MNIAEITKAINLIFKEKYGRIANFFFEEDKFVWNDEFNKPTDDEIKEAIKKNKQEEEEDKIKLKKKKEIGKIATLTDQLNLIAGVLAEQVEVKLEEERTDLEKKALKVYKSIMKVLNQ